MWKRSRHRCGAHLLDCRHRFGPADLSFDDVVMINSFHLWEGPNFAGTKAEQFQAFEQVKEEFMHGPKPAWTAVGTTGLLPDNGIVEIQMIAAAPEKRPRKR